MLLKTSLNYLARIGLVENKKKTYKLFNIKLGMSVA
jgi:hypothetical protein